MALWCAMVDNEVRVAEAGEAAAEPGPRQELVNFLSTSSQPEAGSVLSHRASEQPRLRTGQQSAPPRRWVQLLSCLLRQLHQVSE